MEILSNINFANVDLNSILCLDFIGCLRIGSKTYLFALDDRREIHKQNRFDEFVGQAKYYFIIQQLPEPERFVNRCNICKTIFQ